MNCDYSQRKPLQYRNMIKIALFQPDIPQNVGAAMRFCACLGMELHIIEPCGFVWDARKIRQAALDYAEQATVIRHDSWDAFKTALPESRRILMTTKAAMPYTEFEFQSNDILLAGRESAGAPDYVHNQSDARVLIPLQAGTRSLNILNASAMIAGEALRQTKGFNNHGR